MKQLILPLSLLVALFFTSVYATPLKSVSNNELIDLPDICEYSTSSLPSYQTTKIHIDTCLQSHNTEGLVQLIENDRGLINYAPLIENDHSILHIHPDQRARYLKPDSNTDEFGITFVAGLLPDLPAPPGLETKRKAKDKGIAIRKPESKIGEFTKIGYGAEVKRFSFRNNGFTHINFNVQIQEKYGIIVNAIAVLANGQPVSWKTMGVRLSNGDNIYPIEIPANANAIQVALEHGQGSRVQIYLTR